MTDDIEKDATPFPDHLIVATMPLANVMELDRREDGSIHLTGGVEVILLDVLSKTLQFDYTMTIPSDYEWGRLQDNGSWSGLIGMINRSEADIGVAMISKDEAREQVVDYSVPYAYNEITFVTHLPGTLNRTFAFMQPFDLRTWICLAVSIFIVSLVFHYIFKQGRNILDILTDVFASVVRQEMDLNILKGRFFAGLWWMSANVLSFSYTGLLFSFLAIPLQETPIRTFQEMAMAIKAGKYQCFINRGTMITQVFLSSGREDLITVGSAMEQNDWFVPITDYLNEKKFDGKTAFIGPRSLFYYRFGKAPFTTKFVPEESGFTIDLGIVMRKNFCCKEMIDKTIQKIKYTGIFQKITNDQLFKTMLQDSKNKTSTPPNHEISVNDVIGVLILFLLGLLLSLLVFIFEVILNMLYNKI